MKKRLFSLLSVLPSILCLVLLFDILPPLDAATALLAIFIHEWGHIAIFSLLRQRIPALSTQSGGLSLSSGFLSYREELLYAGGGALANLATAFVTLFAIPFPVTGVFATKLCAFSLLYAAFNLIPAPPLDGAKILSSSLSLRLSDTRVRRVTKTVSILCILLFLFSSLYFSLGDGSFFYGIFLSLRLYAAHLHAF